MVWVKVKRIEESKYNNGSYLAYFNIAEREKFAVITPRVLQYLDIDKVRVDDVIYVIKSFGKNSQEIWFVKNVEK